MAKIKKTFYFSDEALAKAELNARKHNFSSSGTFIEEAIHFYSGYINSKENKEFFARIFLSTFKGVIDSFEDRISRLLFKNAVEISMLLHVVSATMDITQDDLTRLRGTCIAEVKKNNGNISFEEALKYQKGGR